MHRDMNCELIELLYNQLFYQIYLSNFDIYNNSLNNRNKAILEILFSSFRLYTATKNVPLLNLSH